MIELNVVRVSHENLHYNQLCLGLHRGLIKLVLLHHSFCVERPSLKASYGMTFKFYRTLIYVQIYICPNISRVENDKNHSGIWIYQSVSPSLRVPRSRSAPSLINTSIIAFIDFLKFIHHYIISDFGPLGRTVQMRIIQIEMGWVGVMVHNLWIIIFRLSFLPRAFGSKMTYNCSAIFIEWININTNWHFVQLKKDE